MTQIIYIQKPAEIFITNTDLPAELVISKINMKTWKLPFRFLHMECFRCGDMVIVCEKTVQREKKAFTRQQLRVIERISQGKTVSQVAYEMGISTSTVLYHLNAMKKIVGVRTRNELILHYASNQRGTTEKK